VTRRTLSVGSSIPRADVRSHQTIEAIHSGLSTPSCRSLNNGVSVVILGLARLYSVYQYGGRTGKRGPSRRYGRAQLPDIVGTPHSQIQCRLRRSLVFQVWRPLRSR
jgi:hypothetical protein